MELYNGKFMKYIYEKENSLLEFYWSSETENMSDEEYKELMLKGIGFVELYNPKYVINNSKKKTYVTSVEMQEWAAENALSRMFKNGVVKFAIVESEDLLIQLATEQAVEEDEDKKYGVMFFDSEEKARKWLLEK